MILSLLASAVLTFATPPSATTAKLAGDCMTRGHTVISISEAQVKCQIALDPTSQANILFVRFHQRSVTSAVQQYISFTVVPTAEGSMVQHRVWQEAMIRGELRTYEVVDPNIVNGVQNHLVTLGGTLQGH